jgi:hypothetical protein
MSANEVVSERVLEEGLLLQPDNNMIKHDCVHPLQSNNIPSRKCKLITNIGT